MKLSTPVSVALTILTINNNINNNGSCNAFVTPLKDMMRSMPATISMEPLLNNPSVTNTINSINKYTNSIRKQATRLNAIPTLDNWSLTRNGEASGRVSNHPNPSIYDGEMVTTSPLKTNSKTMKEGATVITASGSKYKLGSPKSSSMTFGGLGNMGKFNNPKNKLKKNDKASNAVPKNGKQAKRQTKTGPLVNDWFISFRGELIGVISNHPDRAIADGDTVTTSKINENKNSIKEGDVVTTSSGSVYVLGNKKKGLTNSFFNKNNNISNESAEMNGGTFNSGVRVDFSTNKNNGSGESSSSLSSSRSFGLNLLSKKKPMSSPKSQKSQKIKLVPTNNNNNNQSSPSSPWSSSQNAKSYISSKSISLNNNISKTFGLFNQQLSDAMSTITPPTVALAGGGGGGASTSDSKSEKQRLKNLKDQYGINGKTLANGKYLLCDRARRSTSGKSNIWSAYQADSNGNPIGNKLTIKVSTNFDSMIRENNNYNRVCSGLFPGRFVDKAEFLEELDGYPGKEFETSCALVIENGRKDLRAILNERGGRGFEGKAMRDAASASLQCIQAMHSSGIVWTDLKTENFVIVSDEIGDNGMLPGVKGIDLESAIRRGKNPVDFSPEACPPEFATAFIAGQGLNFKLDYSYDIWSYGMMLYELTTGRPYFDNKTPAQITMSLQYEFEADLSSISDDKLRDLISLCLRYDAKKRPGVTQLLLHPYFLSSGLGPFGW